jgi:hypothetical protein
MDEKNDLSPANREFEMALRSLSPAVGRIDPISAAFAAGRRSANHRLHVWQSAVAAMLVVNVGLWLIPIRRYAAPIVAQVQTISVSQPTLPPSSLSEQSIAVMEQRVLEHGVDALPVSHMPTQRPLRLGDSL